MTGRPHPGAPWFAEVAERLGGAYLRYDFTRGTTQEVEFLVDLLDLEPGGRVLDVGCGPGRHVLALARRGHLALGVDIAPAAVRLARRRGAPVIEASVFARIPGTGTWGSALLLDGTIGIGGAPGALLGRLRQLLRPGGEVLVELAPAGVGETREQIRLEVGAHHSRSFAWAYVGAGAIDAVALAAGFSVAERWQDERRWFARLVAAR